MGCCNSTDRGDRPVDQLDGAARVPNRDQHNNGSAAAIHQPIARLSDSESTQASSIPQLDNRLNEQLRPLSPLPSSPATFLQHPPPWTRTRLNLQREEFFDTRVSGDPRAWVALRTVCRLLNEGNLAEAQTLLDAAELTCPRGRVVRSKGGRDRRHGGVYDRFGGLYEIPKWVVSDPEDVIEDEADKEGDAAGAVYESDEDDLKSHAPASPTQEKGKGRAQSLGKEYKVICRRSDKGYDVTTRYQEKELAGVVLQRVHEKIGDKRVRLIFRGKPVDVRTTLADQGWKEGLVINAFVDDDS